MLAAAALGWRLNEPAGLSTKSESNESLGVLAAEPVAERVIAAVIAATMTQATAARMIFIRELKQLARFNESCDIRSLLQRVMVKLCAA